MNPGVRKVFKINSEICAQFREKTNLKKTSTVKLGFKERLNKEQISNSEPFTVTNLPVYFINSEQPGVS